MAKRKFIIEFEVTDQPSKAKYIEVNIGIIKTKRNGADSAKLLFSIDNVTSIKTYEGKDSLSE